MKLFACPGFNSLLICLAVFLAMTATADAWGFDAEAELAEQREQGGYLPSEAEVAEWLANHQKTGDLDREEANRAYGLWLSMQKPPVSVDELREAVLSRRERSGAVKLRYAGETHRLNQRGGWDLVTQARSTFARQGNKRYIDTESSVHQGRRFTRRTVSTFDGEKERSVETVGGGSPSGFVQSPRHSGVYYDNEFSPLVMSMTSSSLKEGGMSQPAYDLEALLWGVGEGGGVFVQEKPETIEGVEATVVYFGSAYKVYLDPSRAHAVLRLEVRSLMQDEGEITSFATRTLYRRDHLDLVEAADGLWLPRRVVAKHFSESGDEVRRTESTLLEVEVDPVFAPDFFVDVFPAGTTVTDVIRDVGYVVGEEGEAVSLLGDEASFQALTAEGVGSGKVVTAPASHSISSGEAVGGSNGATSPGQPNDSLRVAFVVIVVLGLAGVVFSMAKSRAKGSSH